MTFRIVSLDPGGTTGWASFTSDGDSAQWICGQLAAKNHHDQLDNMLGMMHTDQYHIVCESFEYRNVSRAGLVLDSVEYIGVMKRYAQCWGVSYTMQTASQGKVGTRPNAFVKPSNLRKLGLWSPGNVHAMDAYGHLLYYMINNADFAKTQYGKLKFDLLGKGWKED